VIEVYRGKYEPERNLITYALYVMFFPQLVAGPIERPQHLLPQLNTTPAFNAVGVRHGLELMLVGFFKKVVIADQLAPLVDHLFTPDITHNGAALLIASAAFTYQLYCDFSGYSDIAVGAALVLGYNLVQNFNRPFAARSIAEFWRRWHISLSSWLRDYLYYPLAFGGAHVTKVRLYMSTLITFVLIGLWHGANWTYVVMGALHGIYLVSSALTEKLRAAIVRATHIARVPWLFALWQTGCVFLLVMVSFIFFRATSLSHALSILTDVLRAPFDYPYLLAHWSELVTVTGVGIGLKGVLIAICALELHQYFQEKKSSPYIFDTAPRFIRILWYYVLLFAVLGLGYFGEHAFIYFQF
jgi:D-alanyl-lipoteichoic acid acyltransferase DltB (MBOAT superfamily)